MDNAIKLLELVEVNSSILTGTNFWTADVENVFTIVHLKMSFLPQVTVTKNKSSFSLCQFNNNYILYSFIVLLFAVSIHMYFFIQSL